MITIRLATIKDTACICSLNRNALGYDYSQASTQQQLTEILSKAGNRIFVADDQGEIIGYIHGNDYDCTYADPLKNIMAIAVDPSRRSQGIGKLLLDTIEGWAKEEHCAGVRLVSGFNRQEAHTFYLHCGYTLRKDQKNFIKYI